MNASEWQQAKSLIFGAVTRSSAEREAYIARRCADSTLRAEIESLLRALDRPERLADLAIDELPEPADLTPGQAIGPYVILDRLGRGGMGEVFLANDSRLERKVALKCLLASRNVRSDILREARVAARITHPNVAAIHDLIDCQTRAFIVMEYVEGETLGERLKRERLPMTTVIAIGRQLASALSAAHAAGIIHRDLKPGNIQIARDGSVKVLDFGVAHVMSAASHTVAPTAAAATAVRPATALVGTPGYMSPEQMLGGPVDVRSDIFSLGVVLFEMATGRRLFAEADPFTAIVSIAKTCARADDIDPEVPRELANVLARALDLDPAQRFQSAGEVERALAELEVRPVEAAPIAANDSSQTPEATIRGFRERLILATVPAELRRLRYEVERYLADRPNDVDGSMLRDAIGGALDAALAQHFVAPDCGSNQTRRTSAASRFAARLSGCLAGAVAVVLLVVSLWPTNTTRPGEGARQITSVAGGGTGSATSPTVRYPIAPETGSGRLANALGPGTDLDRLRARAEVEADRLQLASLLVRYKLAVEAKDLNGVKAIWPGLGGSEERRIAREFAEARSIRIDVTHPFSSIAESTGVVKGVERVVTIDQAVSGGAGSTTRPRTTVKKEWLTIDLKLRNDEWVIAGVSTPIIPIQEAPQRGGGREKPHN